MIIIFFFVIYQSLFIIYLFPIRMSLLTQIKETVLKPLVMVMSSLQPLGDTKAAVMTSL